MKKIIEYKILYAPNFKSLEEDVNKAIKEGWQPLGSLFIEKEGSSPYNQAMVKYETQTK